MAEQDAGSGTAGEVGAGAASGPEFGRLIRALRGRVPVDAAALLAEESPERIAAVLRALPQDLALRVAYELPESKRPPADRIGALDVPVPGTVADLMESAPAVLSEDATVAGAVDFLVGCDDVTQITYLYVHDAAGTLTGLIIMRDLLLAKPGQKLSEIMLRHPFTLTPGMEAADAVRAAVRRHYPVYPVVDANGKLVGQVRGWRLFEVQAIELTAQSGRMVGVDKEERITTSMWASFRMRHPWLQINLLTAFLAAGVVGFFQDTIAQVVALAAFLPVLAGQSGNTGCQALAITLRGLTLGDLEDHPVRAVLMKELALGFWNGLLTGVVAGIAMFMTAAAAGNPDALVLGIVIVTAMVGACMASGVFGVLVPIVLKRTGADPATASSIFLTTGTDIVGMGLMLMLATILLL